MADVSEQYCHQWKLMSKGHSHPGGMDPIIKIRESAKDDVSSLKSINDKSDDGKKSIAMRELEHELEQALLAGEALAEQLEKSELRSRVIGEESDNIHARNAGMSCDMDRMAESLHLAAERMAELENALAASERKAVEANASTKTAVARRRAAEDRLQDCERMLKRSRAENARANKELERLQEALENAINTSANSGHSDSISANDVERIVQFLEKQLVQISFGDQKPWRKDMHGLEKGHSDYDENDDDGEGDDDDDKEEKEEDALQHGRPDFGKRELYAITSADEEYEDESERSDAGEGKNNALCINNSNEAKCGDVVLRMKSQKQAILESKTNNDVDKIKSKKSANQHKSENKGEHESKAGPPLLPAKPKGLAVSRMTKVSELIKKSLENNVDSDEDDVQLEGNSLWGIKVSGKEQPDVRTENDESMSKGSSSRSKLIGHAASLKKRSANKTTARSSSILVEANRKQLPPGTAIPSKDVPALPTKPTHYHLRPMSQLNTLSTTTSFPSSSFSAPVISSSQRKWSRATNWGERY